jgi:uncharacterized membrane protein
MHIKSAYFKNLSVQKIFLFFAVPWGFTMIFLTPPLQVPDEQAHFFKAFQLSEGKILPQSNGISLGGQLPVSLTAFMEVWKVVIIDKKGKVSVNDFQESINIPLNPHNTQFTSYLFTALYSPIPHIPQATGIFLGRILNLPVLVIFYLGRLFNLLFCTIILFIAIKNIPVFKWLFLFIALMPMTIYLAGSLSGDAITISLAILFISLVMKLTFEKTRNILNHEFMVLLLIGLLLTLAKNTYFPIILLGLLIPVKKFGSIKNYIIKILTLLSLASIVVVFYSNIVHHFFSQIDLAEIYSSYPGAPHFNPDKQLDFILSNPLYFLSAMIHSFWFFKAFIIETHVGAFGWDFYRLPLIHIYLYPVLLLAFVVLETKKEINIGGRQKILLFISLSGSILVFSLIMYMIWAAVGANQLTNLQGRYFIPIIPLFWMLFYNRKISVRNNILKTSAFVILFFSMISTIGTLIERYYLA